MEHMKKLLLILILVTLLSSVYAQKGKIHSASSLARAGDLKKAKELVDKGIDHKNCLEWSKAYYVKGIVYQFIYESTNKDYRKLSDTPLEIAYDSYKKCINLDTKGRFKRKMNPYYNNLRIDFAEQGKKFFNEGNFTRALESFKSVLEINNSKILAKNRIVDTPTIYYTALCAFKLGKYEGAIPLYEKVLKYNYKPEKCYINLSEAYLKIGDKEKGFKYLHEGIEKYPNDVFLLGELINFYLFGKDYRKAEQYINSAIEQEPNNILFYRAKGTLLDKMGRFDDAVKMYEKALKIDPNDFISLYNIGLVKYNKVTKHHKYINDRVMNNYQYSRQIRKVLKEYEQLIPDFEKAHRANLNEIAPVIVLKEIYTKLKTKNSSFRARYKYYSRLKVEMESK